MRAPLAVAAMMAVMVVMVALLTSPAAATRHSIPIQGELNMKQMEQMELKMEKMKELKEGMMRELLVVGGPGSLQVAVTGAGVQAVQRALRPELVNRLLDGLVVPPLHGKQDLNVLGFTVELDYSVANVSIFNVTFANDTVALVPGSGLAFSVTDGSAKITADFTYAIPFLSLGGTGQADIDVSQLNVQVQVNATSDEKGYPVVSCPAASIVLGQFQTKITSSSSILDAILQFFLFLFNGTIKNQIQDSITSAVYSSLDGVVNELIHNQSLFIGLPPNGSQVVIDVSLPSPPVFAPNYLLLPVTGEVFLAPGLHSNYTPTPIPTLVTGQMLQLSVGQYLFDTAGWAYYKSGLLNYLITNNDLPSWLPFKLNTASFSFLIPALDKLYPNMDMNLDFFVARPIGFNITPASKDQGVAVDMVGDMQVNVIADNGTFIPVFVLETTFKLNFSLYFNDTSVHGKFYITSFNSVIKSSQIGSFDVSLINFLLDAVFNNVLFYPVNLYLAIYPLFTFPPIQGFQYLNPNLVYGTDFVALSSDFTVTAAFARALGL